jgi:hypothetical protein
MYVIEPCISLAPLLGVLRRAGGVGEEAVGVDVEFVGEVVLLGLGSVGREGGQGEGRGNRHEKSALHHRCSFHGNLS